MIDGVIITPLKQIRDERGAVMHMLRTDAPHFAGFGEVYFSVVNPGVAKDWRRHTQMTMSLTVPKGRVKLVLSDGRGDIQEITLGEDEQDYKLVTVPPMVWSAFKCLSADPAIITNCASIMHTAGEADRLPLDTTEIEYTW
ncbi:MAG: dTDP-4-dehydrorhamnose 3,5-epimerase [Rhodospirillaceae bacterium]|nr:MAG: dTDP-4-dehydrorhamnose 3,5-epimerase [Rhodospirillaceae bacterium]